MNTTTKEHTVPLHLVPQDLVDKWRSAADATIRHLLNMDDRAISDDFYYTRGSYKADSRALAQLQQDEADAWSAIVAWSARVSE